MLHTNIRIMIACLIMERNAQGFIPHVKNFNNLVAACTKHITSCLSLISLRMISASKHCTCVHLIDLQGYCILIRPAGQIKETCVKENWDQVYYVAHFSFDFLAKKAKILKFSTTSYITLWL